jgi:chromatin structure-remodeling complex subunit RSC9
VIPSLTRAEDEDRYTCLWHGCTSRGGNTSTAQLLSHIQSTHLGFVQRCHWATCRQSPVTLSHVLTHLPLSHRPPVPDQVSSDSRATEGYLSSKKITQRPIPPLPRSFKLHFTGQVTPADKDRNPTGVAFLSALVIRNLARTLRGEIASALPADHGLSKEEKEEKRRHLQEEQFGLPIPDSILKEEEEEEKTAAGEMEGGLSWEEREKAKLAFEAVEDRVVGVIQGNFSGVGQYLGEAFGW